VGLLEAGEVGISATNRNFKGRMGSRDAKCYLASPAVVAASALAGFICGPEAVDGRRSTVDGKLQKHFTPLTTSTVVETVEILPGFPERVRGRMVFLNKDNLNTDGIYAGAYTYREDMTPAMMAAVVFDNYDPELTKRLAAGDVIVGGANFGTGSSREQAVTALKARGIPLVIAASFSQTYLRNAFNNGFLCVEQPELVDRLKQEAASQKSWIPGEEIEVDFTKGVVTWRGDAFHFPALGSVPQSLVVAGGVENLVSRKLGLKQI
jgi:homoaconitate hydratase